VTELIAVVISLAVLVGVAWMVAKGLYNAITGGWW